jgi:ribosomal protein S18 acetylase RimI-like enzyme
MLLLFFGVRRTVRMLLRGLVLESELPAPKSSQSLIAHCATRETMRGTGVFSALFTNALHAGSMDGDGGRQIVLDVLVSNTRAYDLYRRLGFVELPRRGPVSPRLPRELESVRMGFVGRG